MARRRIGVADIKAVLIAWEAGQSVSAIARMLGYTRPTVRRYIEAARRLLGLPVAVGQERWPVVGQRRRTDVEWAGVDPTVQARRGRRRAPGAASAAVTQHQGYLVLQ